jgi:hypothetical protein
MDEENATERPIRSTLSWWVLPEVTPLPTPYLEFVRKHIFPDAVGYTRLPGAPTVLERRLAGGRLVEVEIPRWRMEDLMHRHHEVGEQLPFL